MLNSLISFVTVVLALSVASERLVELVKGFFSDLTGQKPSASVERKRQLTIHWMSLVASAVVVFLMQDYIINALEPSKVGGLGWEQGAVFTLLSCGGSSLWNSILSYLLSLKNLKQQDVTAQQKAGNSDLFKSLPAALPARQGL